jgi:hypothetical protein
MTAKRATTTGTPKPRNYLARLVRAIPPKVKPSAKLYNRKRQA